MGRFFVEHEDIFILVFFGWSGFGTFWEKGLKSTICYKKWVQVLRFLFIIQNLPIEVQKTFEAFCKV